MKTHTHTRAFPHAHAQAHAHAHAQKLLPRLDCAVGFPGIKKMNSEQGTVVCTILWLGCPSDVEAVVCICHGLTKPLGNEVLMHYAYRHKVVLTIIIITWPITELSRTRPCHEPNQTGPTSKTPCLQITCVMSSAVGDVHTWEGFPGDAGGL